MPRIKAPTLRSGRKRRPASPTDRRGTARGRWRINPSIALPLGENDLLLELPDSFHLDAERVFNTYLDLCKKGVVLEAKCTSEHRRSVPFICKDHGAPLRDIATRIAWICGMYLELAALACDDFEDHDRAEATERLWRAAGRMAIAADEGIRENPESRGFAWTPGAISAIRKAPDVRGLLRDRAESRMRLEITSITRGLVPALDDAIANAMLLGSGPCEVLAYWARVRGSEDATAAWEGGYAPPTEQDAADQITATEIGELVRARLGVELSRMELGALARTYNESFSGRVWSFTNFGR